MLVLSYRFQHLFLDALEKAYAKGQLQFFGTLQHLSDPQKFAAYLAPLRDCQWVVYAKSPFGGPPYVVQYLGRYVNRVAISNRRLRALQDGQVSFEYKDYRDGGISKIMTVAVDEFIRRFLLHVVPPGFQRIRYYGFLANCHRARQLQLCRKLLATPASELLPSLRDCQNLERLLTAPKQRLCPHCGIGVLVIIQRLAPERESKALRMDSS